MVTLEFTGEAHRFAGFKITHTCESPGIDSVDRNEHTIVIDPGRLADVTCSTHLPTATPCNTHLCISISPAKMEQTLGSVDWPRAVYIYDDDQEAVRLGQCIYDQSKDGRVNQPLYVESLCIALLLHVNERYQRARPCHHAKGKLSPWQLATVSEYIHSRLGHNISLKELCGLVSLSRYHFTRLFKGTLGMTPHRYILQSKVEYAKTVMTKRKGAILDAAYQLSFSDHAHFTNTFRKITGITPKSFLNIEEDIEHIGT